MNNLVAVFKVKEILTLHKLANVGMCILDLSMTLLFDFHYIYTNNRYGITDTDRLYVKLKQMMYI